MDSVDLKDELTCSVCLNIFRDPVTLNCGHNFCRGCTDCLLSKQDSTGVYKCPTCENIFAERPSPQRNVTLSSIAERFLSMEPEQKTEESEVEEILCSYCIHSSVAAVKSCLLCEASLCEEHLRVHSKSAEHVLSNPTASPKITKCPDHDEVLKYFCSKDNTCICVSCSLIGKHKGHKVDSLQDAAQNMKEQLKDVLENLTTMKGEAVKKLQILEKRKTKLPEISSEIKKKLRNFIQNIRNQLDLLEAKVVSETSRQEDEASTSISDLIQQLEKERDVLSTEIGDIKEIRDMTDPLSVLQEGASFYTEGDGEDEETRETDVHVVGNFDEGLLFDMLHTTMSDMVMSANLYCHEATGLILDPSTASMELTLSADFTSASRTWNNQGYHNQPERFTTYPQVLSTMSFSSGRQYWEVETNGTNHWMIGMCYSSMERNGPKSLIGANDKSWGLKRENNRYSVSHSEKVISLTPYSSAYRIRVYLDYEAGRISFYELCHPLTHLHTYKTTFTEPLHVVLSIENQSWIRLRS
ncbi:E3 ubiquitin/ISG15 ligase TRIM25-like [Engystomops pustulosus]|uniref:E3 ubiquitin/ISG15 ligase TRIM25-like n=1 Tax=Engystomops pustulosus TaxID=76066 RepID=UPI003AFB09A5